MQTPPKTNGIDRRVVRIMSQLIKLLPTTQIMQMRMYLTHSLNKHSIFFSVNTCSMLMFIVHCDSKCDEVENLFYSFTICFQKCRKAGVFVSIRGNKGIQIIRKSIPFHLSTEIHSILVVDAFASNNIISSLFIMMIRAF